MVASVKQDEALKRCSYEFVFKAGQVLSVEDDDLYCDHYHRLLSSYVVPYATQPTVELITIVCTMTFFFMVCHGIDCSVFVFGFVIQFNKCLEQSCFEIGSNLF